MRILAFGDTHGSTDFSHLAERAKQANVILAAGDLTDFGDETEDVLRALQSFAKEVDKHIIWTHGNHEAWADFEPEAFDRLHYLHGAVLVNEGLAVYGYGGGGFSKKDVEFERFIKTAYAEDHHEGRLQIWLMHGPPHDTKVDEIPGWGPTGCQSKRKMIERIKPHIVISGHIHEAHGVMHQIGRTMLLNPGPGGVLIDVQTSEVSGTSDDADLDPRT